MIDVLKKLLESTTETEVLEFKKASRGYDKNKLGKYFSALSNEANLLERGEAWILFGINNDKGVVGTSITDVQLNEYKIEISSQTAPRLGFSETHRVKYESKTILMLKVPPAPQGMPIAWKGHYYARAGESLVALDIAKIERIRHQSGSNDWSAEIVKGATVLDLSENAIAEARVQFAKKKPNLKDEISKWDAKTFLNKVKLLKNGEITKAVILLLGKPESSHFIGTAVSTITWILKDRDNIEKDYLHFSCPFFLEVNQVYRKIRNNKYRYMSDRTLFPEEIDQYDPFIIREALNNCIAHQDYRLNGKIVVVEREDGMLTFVNNGSFLPGTVESVIITDAPAINYRNPFFGGSYGQSEYD